MEYYIILLYIAFGLLPSLIWLFYYLGKDMHPEPKKMIIKVFFWGFIITVPTFLVQLSLSWVIAWLYRFEGFASLTLLVNFIKWFIIISLVEELAKYGTVKFIALGKKEVDEPLDIMLYMVVGALGFASLENVLYIFSPIDGLPLDVIVQKTIAISFIRFIGATFLHTLCSALLGYFVALSYFHLNKRRLFTITGIFLAVVLHGLYDFSIITLRSPINFIIPMVILLGLALFIISQFERIKKLKSICNLK